MEKEKHCSWCNRILEKPYRKEIPYKQYRLLELGFCSQRCYDSDLEHAEYFWTLDSWNR